LSLKAIEFAEQVAEKGNPNTLSDAGVASLTARSAGDAALYNVLINLPGIADVDFARGTRIQALQIAEELRSRTTRMHEQVLTKLSSS
jgi:glutamate formiminotransferase/formiminotetrahydrofolate cyclodeaminase